MLSELGSIAENKANSNETTVQSIKQLLNYCATHLDATKIYNQNEIVLCVHSDG